MDKQTAQTFISPKNQLAHTRVASPLHGEEFRRADMSSDELSREQLSREAISRCISIWATVYGLREPSGSDNAALCLPSRPWMGRSVNSVKPFV